MSTTSSFKDLPAWQQAMQLVVAIYQLTAQLPTTERLGLSGSLQQSALTVPTLLASGIKQGRDGFVKACLQARYNCAEVETLLYIAQQAYPTIPIDDLLAEVIDLQTVLTTMVKRLTQPSAKTV